MDYFLVYLIVGIVVYKLCHGIAWTQFAGRGFRSIRFGMSWKFLTPYCHRTEPLKVKHYRIGGAAFTANGFIARCCRTCNRKWVFAGVW